MLTVDSSTERNDSLPHVLLPSPEPFFLPSPPSREGSKFFFLQPSKYTYFWEKIRIRIHMYILWDYIRVHVQPLQISGLCNTCGSGKADYLILLPESSRHWLEVFSSWESFISSLFLLFFVESPLLWKFLLVVDFNVALSLLFDSWRFFFF